MERPSLLVQVGSRIKAARIAAGMSRAVCAETSGTNPSYLARLERGEQNASLTTLGKIALALDVPLARFVDGVTVPPEPGP